MNVTIYVPHAIIFLYDLAIDDILIPEYINNSLIASNSDCLSIGTQSEVDGEVTINLSNKISETESCNHINIFSGELNSPSKKIAVSTSEDDGILEIDVAGILARVSVWVDDCRYPSSVFIEAK